jgi:hypothetical protein
MEGEGSRENGYNQNSKGVLLASFQRATKMEAARLD